MSLNFDKLDRETQVRSAHEKAIKVLKDQEVSLDDFSGLRGYGPEVIQADKEKVVNLEHKFSQEMKSNPRVKESLEFAKIIEAIIIENIELSDWMGETAETLPVSRYDDYVNGVDTIVEMDEGNDSATHLVLGIDVTIANEMTKKLDRIKREIDHNELAKVKYFNSESLHFRGEMKNIPRVVIALDGQTAGELIGFWTQPTGGKDALAGHFIQHQILEEIKIQLETFREYCRQGKHEELASQYECSLKVIDGVISKKKEVVRHRDEAFSELKRQIDQKFLRG